MNDEFSEFLIASIVGLAGWFFGGLDGFMNVLLAFMTIDYIMGLSIGYVRHELNSSRGFKGILNGSTNYILDRMTNEGLEFDEALTQVQELG